MTRILHRFLASLDGFEVLGSTVESAAEPRVSGCPDAESMLAGVAARSVFADEVTAHFDRRAVPMAEWRR